MQKERVSSLRMAILMTTENAKDAEERVFFLGTAISVIFKNVKMWKIKRVSSLKTAILVISKNVKTIVIENRGKWEDIINQADLSRVKYQFKLGLTRLINLFRALAASIPILGFEYIGFGFSFWVLDRYQLHFGQMLALALCMACWIDGGFDS
ncbi:hypothetical protein RhiirA4_465801 [Rhizophagus irregularis]|uniref:Uncharacterized protein n=1 Tax=Rhizophagus irregularis TaxID=588596 RepID=A0A2I1GSW2_9GLOM|nr:hypothetical protein RhiirA4_465801 [Rhizophagus irregularis]